MDTEKSSNQFNEWSHTYDSGIWYLYFKKAYEECSQFVRAGGRIRVLDVGCGTASLYSYLKKKNPEIEYTGLDISKGMLEVAESKFGNEDNVTLRHENITDFKSKEKYDYIFCLNSFHHYQEHQSAVLTKFNLLLNKGGIVVLLDPVKDGLIRALWSFLLRRIFFHEPEVIYLTSRHLSKLFNYANFQIKSTEYLVYFTKLTVAEKVS